MARAIQNGQYGSFFGEPTSDLEVHRGGRVGNLFKAPLEPELALHDVPDELG